MTTMRIGVLALQGAFAEHVAVLRAIGAEPVEVRLPEHLDDVDGLILPGGESTTMRRLIARWGLRQPLDAATLPLMVAWDALAFAIWVSSFFRNNLRWRQGAYCLREGKLVPAPPD